jgi:hypothetical protein
LIYEWKNVNYRNFGDAMGELILEQMPYEEAKAMVESPNEMHFLIGSHITSQTIYETLDKGYKPIFHGCGWRGQNIHPTLATYCEFRGVRGYQTQAALKKVRINTEVVGDSAYGLLERLEVDINPTGLTYLVPHVLDRQAWQYLAEDFGVDFVEEAKVQTRVDVLEKIEKFANADFVLAGSMHACIVAEFFDVPFAPFMGHHVDCPPKWFDWLGSIGYSDARLKFVNNLNEGWDWYDEYIRPRKDRFRIRQSVRRT